MRSPMLLMAVVHHSKMHTLQIPAPAQMVAAIETNSATFYIPMLLMGLRGKKTP
jgi:hypothetical protein